MQRKTQEDPVVLFASPPDLNDLCSVSVRVESQAGKNGNVTTQPKILKCREAIFTEPDVIAAPSYEQYDCFTVVMSQSLYKTGRLQTRMKKNGLQIHIYHVISQIHIYHVISQIHIYHVISQIHIYHVISQIHIYHVISQIHIYHVISQIHIYHVISQIHIYHVLSQIHIYHVISQIHIYHVISQIHIYHVISQIHIYHVISQIHIYHMISQIHIYHVISQIHIYHPSKPMRVNPVVYQACLRYTLLARLAPAWNKTADWLIQECEVMAQSDQLYLSVWASVLRLSPLQVRIPKLAQTARSHTDLNLSDLEIQSLLYNAEHANGELALHNAWCRVIPSMKKGRLVSISLCIPADSPFTAYRDIKRHWKNTYGFRLPETDDDIFYAQISFCGLGGKQFTYPNICLRSQPLQSVPRVDGKPILSAFLQDVHAKLPAACGHALRFQPQLRYPMANVYPASQEILEDIRSNMATKDGFRELREEMNKVTARLEVHIEQLESTVFDLRGEHDILVAEVKTLKEENKDLHNNLEQRVKEEGNMKRDMNDHEQHSRQFNVRVYGVPEVSGGTETVNDCVDRCLEVFSTKIGVPVSKADIEMAHRTGRPGGPRPRPIIVRFHSRMLRSRVLADRRKLKKTGVSDLKGPGANLSKRSSTCSSQQSLRDPRQMLHMMTPSSTQPAPRPSFIHTLKTSSRTTPEESGMPHTPQLSGQSQSDTTPAALGATTWSRIAKPSPASSQRVEYRRRESRPSDEESRSELYNDALLKSSTGSAEAGCVSSTTYLSTPKSSAVHKHSLSLHKPQRGAVTPFSGERDPSCKPAPAFEMEHSGGHYSGAHQQAKGADFQDFTPQAVKPNSQQPASESSTIFPRTTQTSQRDAEENAPSKQEFRSLTSSLDSAANNSQTVPPRKIAPVFKPKSLTNTKNKTASSLGEAGRGLSQTGAEGGSRLVPTFKPKLKSTAAPQFKPTSAAPKPSGQVSRPRPKDVSSVSSPQVTSTTGTTNIPLLPTQPNPKYPVFNPRKPHPVKNVNNSPSVRSLAATPSPNTVASKLKKKMLSQSGTTPSGVRMNSPGQAGSQTTSTPVLGGAFSQALTLTPGMTMTSGMLSSQGKRKGESVSGGEKKARTKPQVQDLNVEALARVDQLQKVNAVTLISWLKDRGVYCKAKDKKADLVDRVKVFLALTAAEP
ncbi:hypothetical protein ACOMHN_059302 [Nucella lapillus]